MESEAVIRRGVPGHSTGHSVAAGAAVENPGNRVQLTTHHSLPSQRVFLLQLPFRTE